MNLQNQPFENTMEKGEMLLTSILLKKGDKHHTTNQPILLKEIILNK